MVTPVSQLTPTPRASGARLSAAGRFPQSHVVGKNPGSLVTINWAIFNEAAGTLARLELNVDGIAAAGHGTIRLVSPGTPALPSSTPLSLAYVVPLATVAGSYRAHLRMWEVNASGSHQGGEVAHHQWTLNVVPPGGPVLVAVGDPTIE